MAQKLNATNLRLNKRLNWQTKLCAHNFNDYFNLIFNTTQTIKVTNSILNKLNISKVNLLLIKNLYGFIFSYNIFDPRYYFYYLKLILFGGLLNYAIYDTNYSKYKADYLKLFKLVTKSFILNQKSCVQLISNVDSQSKSNKLVIPFNLMLPDVITEFSNKQIVDYNHINLQQNNFKSNIQRNLLKYINYLLFKLKYNIIGLKIVCIGKWKKTAAGRKQRLYLKFGQIKSSNIANKLIYHNIATTTKYGVCSIKIWISHKL